MASAFAKQTAPWPWSKSAPASVTNVRNRSRPPRNLRVVSPVGSVTGCLAGRRLSGKKTPVALEDKFDELSARIDELVATLRRLESLGAGTDYRRGSVGAVRHRAACRTRPLGTLPEAAEILSCSPASIRAWMHRHQIPRVKIGRLVRVRDSISVGDPAQAWRFIDANC